MKKIHCYNKTHYDITVSGYALLTSDSEEAIKLRKQIKDKSGAAWIHLVIATPERYTEFRANCVDSPDKAMRIAEAMRELGLESVHFHRKVTQSVKEML